MARERIDSEGGTTSGGYDSDAVIWSDDPEQAYFRSMLKNERDGLDMNDSLLGDSTMAGLLDAQTLGTSEVQGERIGSGLSWGADGSSSRPYSYSERLARLGGMTRADSQNSLGRATPTTVPSQSTRTSQSASESGNETIQSKTDSYGFSNNTVANTAANNSERSGTSDTYGFAKSATFRRSNVASTSQLGIQPMDPSELSHPPDYNKDSGSSKHPFAGTRQLSMKSMRSGMSDSYGFLNPSLDQGNPNAQSPPRYDSGKGPMTLTSEMSNSYGFGTGPTTNNNDSTPQSPTKKPPLYQRGISLNSDSEGKGPLTLKSDMPDSFGFLRSRSLSPGNRKGSGGDVREVIDPTRLTLQRTLSNDTFLQNLNDKTNTRGSAPNVAVDKTENRNMSTGSQDGDSYGFGPVGQIGFSNNWPANPPSVMASTLSNPSMPRYIQAQNGEEALPPVQGGKSVNPPGFIYLGGNSISPVRNTSKAPPEQRRGRPRTMFLKIAVAILLLAVIVAVVLLTLVLTEDDWSQTANSLANGPSSRPSLTFPPAWVPTAKPTGNPTFSLRPSDAPVTPSPTQSPTTPRPTEIGATRDPTNEPSHGPTLRPTTQNPTIRPTRSPTPRPTSRPTRRPTPAPTPLPTSKPSIGNVQQVFDVAVSRILQYSPRSSSALNDSNSPQSKALNWMVNTDITILEFADFLLVQRWVIATMFYNFEGNQWSNSDNRRSLQVSWLSVDHECEWDHIECNAERMVTSIDLGERNLEGSLPGELFLLSALKTLKLDSNVITGSIPTELGLFAKLKDLRLNNNRLVGSLPTQIGALVKLEKLFLNDNRLTGEIPGQVTKLSALTFLDLAHNTLSGNVPNLLGELADLAAVHLERNDLVGTMPSGFCGKTPTVQLKADCEEISCSCCTDCCKDGSQCIGILPTESPTISAFGGDIITLAPSKAETMTPSATPTDTLSMSPTAPAPTTPAPTTPEPTTAAPSPSPSLRATPAPTTEPTSLPTFKPSPGPTTEPTQIPTIQVTSRATVRPTMFPSTSNPTDLPTKTPTKLPTTPQPTPSPTTAPTQRPASAPTQRPTSTPTQRPTSMPTPLPTPATESPTQPPTLCDVSISREKDCYIRGTDIVVTFTNCEAQPDDWIGIYFDSADPTSLRDALDWYWTCGSKTCSESVDSGTVTFKEVLGRGVFQIFLVRNKDSEPFQAYGATAEFSIDDSCLSSG